MKSFFYIPYVLFSFMMCCLFMNTVQAQSVGINATGAAPNPSAMLDVSATDKGMLIPRMTTFQRTNIISPAIGLLVYDTDTNSFWYYSLGWVQVAAGGASNYWSLNGTNVFNNNSGNVGIGTNAASEKLTVNSIGNGITHTNGIIKLTTYLGSDGSGSPTGGWLGTATNHPLYFYTNGGIPKLSILQNGNVGIGTSSPNNKLQIGSVGASGFNGNDIAIGNGTQVMSFFQSTGASVWYSSTNFALMPGPGGTGKVGIGLSNPSNMLSILSNTINAANNTDVLQLAGRNPLQVFSNEFGTNVAYMKGITDISATPQYPTLGLEIGAAPNTSLYLSANYGPVLTIASNNNVGIGTTNPTYKLSVNGTIRAKEIRINTGWADYVFNKNYKLMPLAEVETFIKNNSRLPGIAPAKKLKKEGVGISEMQTKMMAKIEELTLYIIEANKTIEALKQRMEAVEKSNH